MMRLITPAAASRARIIGRRSRSCRIGSTISNSNNNNNNTRRSFSSSGWSSFTTGTKLLLPVPSVWDNVWDAAQGAWSAATDQQSRKDFETLIQDGVIRDQVLDNAVNGSSMIFALFHQLQNPLWKNNNGFDAKEFVQAVGPALTNLHDVLHRLQNEFAKTTLEEMQEKMAKAKDEKQSSEKTADGNDNISSSFNGLGGGGLDSITNIMDAEDLWRTRARAFEEAKQAKEELAEEKSETKEEQDEMSAAADDFDNVEGPPVSPDELAASLVKMTTPAFLDAAYLSWRLSMMALAATSSPPPPPPVATASSGDDSSNINNIQYYSQRPTYEEGSFRIGQVAILRARIMEVPSPPHSNGNVDDTTSTDDSSTAAAAAAGDNKHTSEDDSNSKTTGGDKAETNTTANYQGDDEHDSRSSNEGMGVAAQIDVLYEATSRFMETAPEAHAGLDYQSTDVSSTSSSSTASSSDDTSTTTSSSTTTTTTTNTSDATTSADSSENAKDDEASTDSVVSSKDDTTTTKDSDTTDKRSSSTDEKKKPPAMDRVKVDSVGVAVLEGWLQGGPDKELRWRVAALRDPYEFPGAVPLRRTILKE